MELPEALREIAEKAVARAKDTCAKAKLAAEQAADVIKETYSTAAKGASLSDPQRSNQVSYGIRLALNLSKTNKFLPRTKILLSLP